MALVAFGPSSASRVVAIDIDRDILDAACDRLAKAGAMNCEFVEGDAYELATFTNGAVDFGILGEHLSRKHARIVVPISDAVE